jgi:hypothetical protein
MRPAVGELVRSTAGQWIARLYGWLPVAAPGRILVGSIGCSCGRHLTWCYECELV